MESPDFWGNQEQAKKVVGELKIVNAQTSALADILGKFEDAKVGYDLAKEAGDRDLLEEVDESLFQLQAAMERAELQALLSGKHDHRNCYVSIQAGAGGTEADDWASMLERMYLYYWNEMGWKIEEISKAHGTETGVSEVTYRIVGPLAFGYMNCERGTHRLARVSPFNAEGKRQTSFATVEVTPEFEEREITVDERECEITAFARSSGPGGQNVNKVASACRVVHRPTGIQVVCSAYRDYPQNKTQALAVLQSKLEAIEEERRAAELNEATGGKVDRGWGTQIRSYVFYDNRVKDHRTNFESGNPTKVLAGDLHGFIDAELKRRRAERN